MRRVLILGTMLILVIAFTGPVMAQESPIPDQIKKFEPIIGYWENQEEQRDSPTGSWVKSSSEWEVNMVLDGYCVQFENKDSFWGSSVELAGYDPKLNAVVSYFFVTNGTKGSVISSGWEGTTNNVFWEYTLPDGTSRFGKCAWVYTSDFKSLTGTCEQFTDGKWWVMRKVKGTKVK
jgi:hypothetical protein